MKNKRIPLLFLLVLVVILGVSTSVSAVRPPVSGAQLILKPVRMEQGKDVRRSYYQIGSAEIKATLAQMGTQIHFTLWEGKQNVFHFSAPASRLGLGSSGRASVFLLQHQHTCRLASAGRSARLRTCGHRRKIAGGRCLAHLRRQQRLLQSGA